MKKTVARSPQHDTPAVYYPLFVNLRKKRAVVVGGGKVAERKILSLLRTGAEVTVISPLLTGRIEKERMAGTIRHVRRHYRKGDLKEAFLVIAATDSPDINEKVSRDAACLVNVVDTPELCNFIVPSVIKRGLLTIAVSTSGVSPALSRSIRRELEKMYGPEFSAYLKSLRSIRAEAKRTIRDPDKRGACLKALASENMLELLRKQGPAKAVRAARDAVRKTNTP